MYEFVLFNEQNQAEYYGVMVGGSWWSCEIQLTAVHGGKRLTIRGGYGAFMAFCKRNSLYDSWF